MNQRRLLLATALSACLALAAAAESPAKTPQPAMDRLLEQIHKDGAVPVIVRVRLDEKFVPEPRLAAAKAKQQRDAMRRTKERVIARHPRMKIGFDLRSLPAFAAFIDEKALRELARDEDVESISEDSVGTPTLAQSIPIVGADDAWASPYNVRGTNKVIVIIDTGVDKTHSFLKDSSNNARVIGEACFSVNAVSSEETCPNVSGNGDVEEIGSGSAVPATFNGTGVQGSDHGTRVAGIAAGSGSSFSGVAPEAKIYAINAASAFDCTSCPTGYKVVFYESAVLRALDHVYDNLLSSDLVAVNMSLAFDGLYGSACDSSKATWADAIDNLTAAGVAVVAGSGNNSSSTGITLPACIGNAIAVGATSDSDTVPTYSNSASIVDLLAPGGSNPNGINSSVPGGGFASDEGTSFAAPHVAGAFALLKQYAPNASAASLLSVLIANGVSVTDSRNSVTKPRLDIAAAIAVVDNQSPTAPGSVMATAVSTTSVQIDWTASTDNVGVSSYVVERKALHGQSSWDTAGTVAGNASLLRLTDTGRTAAATYAYRVRAVDAAQNSTASSTDFATTVIHTDDPIREPGDLLGPTAVRGIHIGDLRKAADAWRAYAGLSASFGSYAAQTGAVDDAHLDAVFTALNGALSAIGRPAFSYTNGAITPDPNVAIDDEHVQQLRDAMK